MNNCILVLNAGSSSIKFALFDARPGPADPALVRRGQISGIGTVSQFSVTLDTGEVLGGELEPSRCNFSDHKSALHGLMDWIRAQTADLTVIGVGHRVVHGGMHRTKPERITPQLLQELDALAPLAPHHQPHNLSVIQALENELPDLPQVACFDTAFHANQPEKTRRIPLPARYAERGVMRYGFHGLSYEYITTAIPAYNNDTMPERLLIAHLGNGASLCAVRQGKSVATTMGFSTLDGLMMGTRCGAIDPGVVLYLLREDQMTATELTDLFYNRCGLLGVSEISADMRVLLASNDPRAEQAIELYCHIIITAIGSMAAVLEGVDGLVFTGGVGEHATQIRARICERLAWLGIVLDPEANARNESLISTAAGNTPTWVIPTNEELVIARHTARIIHQSGG